MNLIELIGYLAMVIVLYSMTMQDIRTLRNINSIACGLFVIYGIAIGSYPIVIMNICVIAINTYKNNK